MAERPSGFSIGKVVKSNGHADYVVQVFGASDVAEPPRPIDHAVGTFVAFKVDTGHLVGVVYDTILLNPEYGSLGPRLSPRLETQVFSPDYLDEKATVLGVVIVGELDGAGRPSHAMPSLAAEVDTEACVMDEPAVRRFHAMPGHPALPRIGYLPRLVARGGEVAPELAQHLLLHLARLFPEEEKLLRVLRENVAFRATVEVLR